MNDYPKGKPSGRHARPPREGLPEGLKRLGNRRLFVDFQDRFPDGTAFRRAKEFEPESMKAALNFLAKARADFARGNGVGSINPNDGALTVASWCEHCVTASMPAQKNGRSPKYSDEALEGFRFVVRNFITPNVGTIRLDDFDKKTVTALIASLPSNEARTKTLNVLTRAMQLAESKGKRKKGTNPCKGVSAAVAKADEPVQEPENWTKTRPANWREQEE